MSTKKDTTAPRTSQRLSGYFQSAGPRQVELTVYQQGGQAVVRELRTVQLIAGPNQVLLEGLPTSYQLNSLTPLGCEGPGEIDLGGVSYRGANLDKQRILAASVGTRVTVKEALSNGKVSHTTGILKAVFGNDVAVERSDNHRLIIVPTQNIELDEGLPAGLSATPSLVMTPEAEVEGEFDLRLLYEAGGLGWTARYSAFFDEKASVITRLDCSVALSNGSGARFENAIFKLLAGANYSRGGGRGMHLEAMALAAPVGGARKAAFAPGNADAASESVGELKLYVLPRAVTLADGETLQVTLFRTSDVPVIRQYFLPAGNGYWNYSQGEGAEKLPVFVRLKAVNDKENKLGTALPAGEFHIFQKDSKGSDQKTGNTAVGHIAEGEKFKVEFGPSSDIKAERRLISVTETEEPGEESEAEGANVVALGGPGMPADRSREIMRGVAAPAQETESTEEPARFREEEREVTVHNFKADQAVEVLVSEYVPENAEWISKPEGHELTLKSSDSAVIAIKVEPKSKTVVRYRLRWQLA